MLKMQVKTVLSLVRTMMIAIAWIATRKQVYDEPPNTSLFGTLAQEHATSPEYPADDISTVIKSLCIDCARHSSIDCPRRPATPCPVFKIGMTASSYYWTFLPSFATLFCLLFAASAPDSVPSM